jgi:hypothetical protein
MVHNSEIKHKNRETTAKHIPQKSTRCTTLHEKHTNPEGDKHRTHQRTYTKYEKQITRKTEEPPQRGTAQLNNRPLKRTPHRATTHKNHKQIGSQGIKLQLLQKTNQLGERAVRLSP